MSETEEEAKLEGRRAAYENIMLQCAAQLGVNDPLTKAAALIAERRDAIAALRSLCERFDLHREWADTLHLADIIGLNIERDLAEIIEEAE